MLGVIAESQENTEIMRRHEAHRRLCLLNNNTEEKTTSRQRTSNYCNWSPLYTSVK